VWRSGVLVLLLVLCSVAPAHAQSPLQWTEVGTSLGRAVGDGTTVAWEDLSGNVVLHASGRPPTVVARPASCPAIGHLGWTVAAVGSDRLLLRCTGATWAWHYAVVSLRFGTVLSTELSGFWSGAGGHQPYFDEIGRHWIAGPFSGYHVNDQLGLNWRTGALNFAARDDKAGAVNWRDPSSRNLSTRLCRPLRRILWHEDISETHPRFRPLQVRGQWVLEGRDGNAQLRGRLRLLRCGSRRVHRLGRASNATLGRRWLVWAPESAPGGVVLRRLRDGWTLRAPSPGTPYGATYALTEDALYASVPITASGITSGIRILRAALPAR
jgi:hypothetical protein